MEFITYTQNWIKGEIFEARLILVFALVLIVSALLFFKTGTTPNAKAMFYPLLVAGLLSAVIGGGMIYNNNKRLVTFTEAYQSNKSEFVKSEKERTNEFISWYPTTRYIFAGLGIAGILIFLFWSTPIGRSIGISMIILTLSTFVIDHFSEERAELYHNAIIEELAE